MFCNIGRIIENSQGKIAFGTTAPISSDAPTDADHSSDATLAEVMLSFDLLEDTEEREAREEVMGELNEICTQWAKQTTQEQGFPDELVEDTTCQLFVYGSFRLGVHSKGTDIDCLCIGPMHISHERFFEELVEKRLKERSDVEEMAMVPGAYVPIAKFKFRGISIDFIYARLTMDVVPQPFDIFDNRILRGCDPQSVRSLNGPRVTDLILQLVPNKDVFREALRVIKLWGKRRAIYANVIGFPGGVSYAIMVARCCQLYPNANSSMVVKQFFRLYKLWKWPVPVCLNAIEKDSSLMMPVWDRSCNLYDKMPIITPAYPAMNSTYNVSTSTLRILKDEFSRGDDILQKSSPIEEQQWLSLVEPRDFFNDHKHYMQVTISSDDAGMQQKWHGWVESKLRRLIMTLEDTPFLSAIPYPYSTRHAHVAKKFADSFFIGLEFNLPKNPPNGKKQVVNISRAIKHFKALVARTTKDIDTALCSIELTHLTIARLPDFVFVNGIERKRKKRKRKGEKGGASKKRKTEPTESSETKEKKPDIKPAETKPAEAKPSEPKPSESESSVPSGVKSEKPNPSAVVKKETTPAPPARKLNADILKRVASN
eukprot:48158_1